MVLVTSDDRPRVPRVGPKVFADVPSAAEIRDLKKSRSQVFVFAVFLIGLIIAAAIGLVVVYGLLQSVRVERDEAVALAEERRLEIAELNTELNSYAEYRGIMDLRERVSQLRGEIGAEVRRYPQYLPPAGPITRIPNTTNGFNNPQAWDVLAPRITSDINAEIAQLERDLAAARAWTVPRPTRTPGQVTPQRVE